MTGIKWIFCVALFVLSGLASGQTEVNPPETPETSTGQLQVLGTHISKLVLQRDGDNHTETFNDPNGPLTLPAGTYRITEITLKDQYVYESYMQSPLDAVVIAEDTPRTLKIGGPLTPSMDVTRQGRQINLAYKLEGVGRETYRSLVSDTSKAPTFTVHRNDAVIDSGTFEYG